MSRLPFNDAASGTTALGAMVEDGQAFMEPNPEPTERSSPPSVSPGRASMESAMSMAPQPAPRSKARAHHAVHMGNQSRLWLDRAPLSVLLKKVFAKGKPLTELSRSTLRQLQAIGSFPLSQRELVQASESPITITPEIECAARALDAEAALLSDLVERGGGHLVDGLEEILNERDEDIQAARVCIIQDGQFNTSETPVLAAEMNTDKVIKLSHVHTVKVHEMQYVGNDLFVDALRKLEYCSVEIGRAHV